jgi:hypothetical protein
MCVADKEELSNGSILSPVGGQGLQDRKRSSSGIGPWVPIRRYKRVGRCVTPITGDRPFEAPLREFDSNSPVVEGPTHLVTSA